jgi:hypothetical protein
MARPNSSFRTRLRNAETTRNRIIPGSQLVRHFGEPGVQTEIDIRPFDFPAIARSSVDVS